MKYLQDAVTTKGVVTPGTRGVAMLDEKQADKTPQTQANRQLF